MLKKILNKKQLTEKVGSEGENSSNSDPLVPYIVVQTPEGEYSTILKNKVTIGSDVGDLIINSNEVSPRHCTFFCNKGVFSLIDHASSSGTFISKRKIEANKVYLLDDKDKFKLGKFNVEIQYRPKELDPDLIEKVIPTDQGLPDLPSEEPTEDETRELTPELLEKMKTEKAPRNLGDLELEEEAEEEVFSDTEIREITQEAEKENTIVAKKMPFTPKSRVSDGLTQKIMLPTDDGNKGKAKKKKKSKKKKIKTKRISSSSALTRVISFINDALITYIIIEICSVFTEFNTFFKTIPNEIIEILKPHFESLAKAYPMLDELTVQINGIEKTEEIFQFLVFLFSIKIISSLVFSLSPGQFLAGMKVQGNFLWKRIIAPIRIVLGIILFPFLIFDLPTIFSKRSFKEVATLTQYVSRGGLFTVILKVLATIILILLAIVSPLYKGGEELKRIMVQQDLKASAPYQYSNPVFVNSLNITLEDSLPSRILPAINLEVRNKKEILRSGILVLNIEEDTFYEIKKLKSFSFTELFASFVDKNPASPQFQPEIFGLVRNVANKNKNFDLKVKNKNKLIAEISQLTEDSFEMGVTNLSEFALRNGLFLGAFRDYREKLTSLYPTPPSNIKIMNLGGSIGIFSEHGAGRMKHFIFVPIGELRGEMYKIEGNFNSPKMKEIRKQLRFGNRDDSSDTQVIADYINRSHKGLVKDNPILNQEIYDRYFDASKEALIAGGRNSIDILKRTINQFITILNIDDKSNQKLTQNLTELFQALKNEDKQFFSISETEVI